MSTAIKNFWEKYEAKIILAAAFILVVAISFESGLIKGREIKQDPIIIEKPVSVQVADNPVADKALEAQNSTLETKKSPEDVKAPAENCAYVGSKNSDKYHLPECRWAKQIKPENTICFSSEDEAKSRGYVPDKNCIK